MAKEFPLAAATIVKLRRPRGAQEQQEEEELWERGGEGGLRSTNWMRRRRRWWCRNKVDDQCLLLGTRIISSTMAAEPTCEFIHNSIPFKLKRKLIYVY